MRLTSTRIATYVASAALAGGLLAIGTGTTASGQPISSHPAVGSGAPTSGDGPSTTAGPTQLLPGDVRVWELTHGHSAAASGLLPGDVRVWELLHPWRP